MPTYDELATSIISELQARTNSQEQLATLVTSIGPSSLTMQLDSTASAGLGVYEVDEELIYVSSADGSGNLTIPGWGRGYLTTTAASHTAPAKVTRAPRFPRKDVKSLINEAISALYPALYGIATTEIEANWRTPMYGLPATAVRVLAAEYQLRGVGDTSWIGIRRWRFDAHADTDQFSTGKAVSLADLPYSTTTVRVTYASEPAALVSGSDDFTTSGLRSTAADLVRLWVVARLVVGPEVAKGQLSSAEQSERSTLVQTGSTTSVARYYQALLASKLRSEQQALRALAPVRAVRTWA